MRSIILAAAAVATLAAPAMAQGPTIGTYLVPALATVVCVAGGGFTGTEQVQCGTNYVAKPRHHHSNDWNFQAVVQNQKAKFPKAHHVYGTQQLQVGINIVGQGDGNSQVIGQDQWLKDNSKNPSSSPKQLQGALNVVEGGNNNTQVISQSQSLTIGGSHDYHKPSVE